MSSSTQTPSAEWRTLRRKRVWRKPWIYYMDHRIISARGLKLRNPWKPQKSALYGWCLTTSKKKCSISCQNTDWRWRPNVSIILMKKNSMINFTTATALTRGWTMWWNRQHFKNKVWPCGSASKWNIISLPGSHSLTEKP